jgi:hypothetical protein
LVSPRVMRAVHARARDRQRGVYALSFARWPLYQSRRLAIMWHCNTALAVLAAVPATE